jgi:hypothetical protein
MKTANRIEVAKIATELTIELTKLKQPTVHNDAATNPHEQAKIMTQEPLALFDMIYHHMLNHVGK